MSDSKKENLEQPPQNDSSALEDSFSADHWTLRDYLLILRERIWYFVVTLFIIFTGVLIYTLTETPLFQGNAMLQILREDQNILGTKEIESNAILSPEDFNTQVQILKSISILKSVVNRLNEKELKQFLAPYENRLTLFAPLSAEEILMNNRYIKPERLTLIIHVCYDHPDSYMAALIANLFAEEYIHYKLKLGIENSLHAVDDLKIRTDLQKKKVESLSSKLAEYREIKGSISLEERADIDHQELSDLNHNLTQKKKNLDELSVKWNLIQEYERDGKILSNLPFIHEVPAVQSLLSNLSMQKVSVATLEKRYKEKHPEIIQAKQNLFEIQTELNAVVREALQKIKAAYDEAHYNYKVAMERLEKKEKQIIHLSKLEVEYKSIANDLQVNQNLYEAMIFRLNSEIAQANLKSPNARIIDKAAPPINPHHPNIVLNLGLGILSGMSLGFIVVMIIAYLDERVKSSFDVEAYLRVPLIGVIPDIKENIQEKAKIVTTHDDSSALESFRATYSSLKMNAHFRRSKLTLITSTVPNEGKSMLATNLSLLFASHGERVLLIDMDLRIPNVANSLHLDNAKGLIQYCTTSVNLDNLIHHNVFPGVDILGTGGKSMKSTEILSGPRLQNLLEEVREKYDRVFIDTPPIAAVSDTLNLINFVDNFIYVIQFNALRRKMVRNQLNRLLLSSTPIVGAVLNRVKTSLSHYYYNNYYDSTYQEYALINESNG